MTAPSGPPPLLVDGRLERVPGGPYDPEAVEIAVSTIRGACGWHIAPVWIEGRNLDCDGGRDLVLPTLRLTDVVDVRWRGAALPLSVRDYEWSDAGILTRWAGWPIGRRAISVTMEHGHDTAPAEIVGLVAELAAAFRSAPAGVKSSTRTVGGVTTNRSFTDSGPVKSVLTGFEHVLARYRVSVPT